MHSAVLRGLTQKLSSEFKKAMGNFAMLNKTPGM